MSFFFGGKRPKVKPQYTGLAIQTSASTLPITLAAGKCRLAPNIFWQNDFKAHKQKQKAGKGGGGAVTSYTYSGSFQMGLCWGEINDVTHTWKDQEKEVTYTKLGFTLFKGTTPQAPWGYLVTKHPDQALGYSGIAYMAVSNYDLGGSNSLSQHSFEVEALLFDSQVDGAGDADCALWIDLFLQDPVVGAVPEGISIIDDTTLLSGPNATTTGDAAYQTYCRAMGFGFSPALSSQDGANALLSKWTQITNTALVWTGYSLKFVPYASDTVSAHGVTYLPSFPIRYTLGYEDYISDKDQDPIRFSRVDPADAKNALKLEVKDRENEYNNVPVEWRDQGLIDQFGLKEGEGITAEEVCVPEMAAVMIALVGQRGAYIRNTYEIKLSAKYCLIEPMDILQLYGKRWGYFTVLVRDVEEDDEDQLTVIAEEYAGTIGQAGPASTPPTVDSHPINTGEASGPINPPIMFQPPSSLTNGQRQIWAAVSGGDGTTADPNWGGCQVWISTDGDVSYNMVGTIDSPARMGVLSAGMTAAAGQTLHANALMSDAEFTDATAADAAAGVTLTYVAPEGANTAEYLSYETATLTGPNAYDLAGLVRAFHGTVASAHATGAKFARLDDELIFKYNFPEGLEGETIYVKFVSFNIFNGGLEDIATVTAYPFTIIAGLPYGVAVEDLNDVSGTPSDGDTLVYDSTTHTWVPGVPDIGPQPYGFAFSKTPVASKILASFDSPIAWDIPLSLTNSQGTIIDSDTATAAAPSAQTDFDIQSPLGASIGTMRFAAASLTATFINATADSIPLGQPVYIVAPANLNGITGQITGSIRGTRN